jgi:tetratricopeptide (TPR) repeat protein
MLLPEDLGPAPADPARWRVLVEVLSEAVRRKPDGATPWYRLALAQLLAGDRDGNRRTCAEVRERFDRTDVADRDLAARACLAAPDAGSDPAPLLRMAEAGVAKDLKSNALFTLGLAHYRAGQYEAAIRRLDESIAADPRWVAMPQGWAVLAMAHHRLGHAAEARRWLAKAHDTSGDAARDVKPGRIFIDSAPNWMRAEFLILRREADALIRDDGWPTDPFRR